MTAPSQAHIDAANHIADLARNITLKYFRQPLKTEQKDDRSPVTIADRQTEDLIRQELNQIFPEHGFYGEESGQKNLDAKWIWVVDPIDGTTSFATGKPTFGTLIALAYENKPVLGLIDFPALDERWLGAKGRPTLHNGEVVKTNEEVDLQQASVYTTTTKMFDHLAMPRYQALSDVTKFGIFGADALAYGLLAKGLTEIVIEASLKPYDYMALVPVVKGAGGCITNWSGKELQINSGDQVIACANKALHQKALAIINA